MRIKKKNQVYSLLLLFLIIYITLYYLDPTLLWDENAYLGNARSQISISYFTEDFRFPLLEYILSFFWIFTGENIFISKLIIILFNIFSAFLFYLIIRKYFKENTLLFTFIFGISPVLLKWSVRIYPDTLAMFFMLLSFYLLLLKNNKAIFFAGITSSLSFLSKFPMALFPFTIFIYLLYKKEFKKIFFFSLGSVIALLPWLIFNYFHYKNPIWDFIEQYKIIKMYTLWEPASKQLLNFLKIFGILTFFFPFGIYNLIKQKREYSHIIIGYVLISLIYFIFFVNMKYMRYLISILPFVLIISYFGIIFVFNKIKLKKIFLHLILILMIVLTIPTVNEIYKSGYCSKNGPIQQSLSYLELKVNPGDNLLSNFWPWFGYSLNTKVHFIYDSLNILINQFRPKYIIHSNILGVDYDKTNLDSSPYLELEKTINGRCNEIISIYKVTYS